MEIIDPLVHTTNPDLFFAEFPCPHCKKGIGIHWSVYNAVMKNDIIRINCGHCLLPIKVEKATHLKISGA